MFPSDNLLRVPIDQFTTLQPNGHDRNVRWWQVAAIIPAFVAGAVLWFCNVSLGASLGSLLTATSILTGFTFSMAVVFWNKSIDARKDPKWSGQNYTLELIDETRTHLIYTVQVGVFAVTAIVSEMMFGSIRGTDWVIWALGWLPVVAGALVIYMITLVMRALKLFNQASIYLR
ncbi:hypothetical protein KEM60_01071 [Austwickia sp. TVS 96-490-7B]|uniref:hypothetical protein n=1 Tax=Austwickia sp. TVS 96-490-7B TaxID=2830843 RepID=UPI001C56FDA4|nr:hypothetical protein [Austwickia sp. TVS 96-490-7B]MBW3084882.1 hypothetical protein [Austwickia sp. TVS 96-490-7B]